MLLITNQRFNAQLNKKYAPFCHGTSRENGETIDKEGLVYGKNVGWALTESERAAPNTIYFGTLRKSAGAERCIGAAATVAYHSLVKRGIATPTKEQIKQEMAFYIMDELPRDAPTVPDEDLYEYKPKNYNATTKGSLHEIGTLGIKGSISSRLLRKMMFDEFVDFAENETRARVNPNFDIYLIFAAMLKDRK